MMTTTTVLSGSTLRKLILGSCLVLLSGALHAGSVSYTYDSLGRLSKASYANGVVITYVYDAAGNRTSYTVTGAPT